MYVMLKKLAVAIAFVTLSSCDFVTIPVTELTLPGCWEGKSGGLGAIEAKFDIKPDENPQDYIIDGQFSGLIDFNFDNYTVTLEGDQLKPRGSSQLLPARIVFDEDRLNVTSTVPPATFSMKRCGLDSN